MSSELRRIEETLEQILGELRRIHKTATVSLAVEELEALYLKQMVDALSEPSTFPQPTGISVTQA